jgi:hypothetical protein
LVNISEIRRKGKGSGFGFFEPRVGGRERKEERKRERESQRNGREEKLKTKGEEKNQKNEGKA